MSLNSRKKKLMNETTTALIPALVNIGKSLVTRAFGINFTKKDKMSALELLKKKNLKVGDKVEKISYDSFRREERLKGHIVIMNGNIFVTIDKGHGQGKTISYTSDWVKETK